MSTYSTLQGSGAGRGTGARGWLSGEGRHSCVRGQEAGWQWGISGSTCSTLHKGGVLLKQRNVRERQGLGQPTACAVGWQDARATQPLGCG